MSPRACVCMRFCLMSFRGESIPCLFTCLSSVEWNVQYVKLPKGNFTDIGCYFFFFRGFDKKVVHPVRGRGGGSDKGRPSRAQAAALTRVLAPAAVLGGPHVSPGRGEPSRAEQGGGVRGGPSRRPGGGEWRPRSNSSVDLKRWHSPSFPRVRERAEGIYF